MISAIGSLHHISGGVLMADNLTELISCCKS